VAELIPSYRGNSVFINPNILYREKPDGVIIPQNKTKRVFETLSMHTGITRKEMNSNLKDKMKILKWLVNHSVNTVNEVGRVVSEYYTDEEKVLKAVGQNKKPETIMREI